MSIQIFLSAVSGEFFDYREQLRHDLVRYNVGVKIQEDFKDSGSGTLDKLDLYIKACDGIVHLVGDMTGAAAKAESTKAILGKYPDLKDKLPPLRQPLESGLDISYTQWEAWLALYHAKLLLIAEADGNAPRGPQFAPTDASRAAQRTHLERLRAVERYPGCTFTSRDNLAKYVLSSAILDLLVEESVAVLLGKIQEAMVIVNADKLSNINVLRDYISRELLASDWKNIQESCAAVTDKLSKLRSEIENKQGQFVEGVGFQNAAILQAALQDQERLYRRLSTLPEPDREQLGAVVDKLEALWRQVVGLETNMKTYLKEPE